MSTLSTIDFPLQLQGKVERPRVSTGWVHLSTNHPGPASDYRVIHRQLSTSTGASSLTGSLHQHKHLPTQQHLPAVGEPVSLGLTPSVEVPETSSYRVLPASHQRYCHASVKSLFCSTTTGSSFFSCDRLVPSFMLEAASCLRLLLCYAGLYCCTSEE